ncbi:tumor necrosis factor receptor superfamily member 11B-like [Engraulis encrasicolus]|uniref:tumor necrosis factor receptor superfamily member 11B-like n=1 Tax=Engraulis encrasicolus TaxID=184585 RepID=UPI002FD2C74E
MSDTMLFLLLLVAYVSPQARGQNSTTYQHTDRATGQILTCDKCRPGYYLREHCTATQPSKCALCEKGLYTECWNYVSECLICDGCYENQDISRPCSPRQNTKCVCKKGYFWSTFYCKRHTVCPSGYGVKTAGTHEKDTECELCPAGFYAAGHPATCQKHTACEALTKITVLKGASWHNAFCASCENVVEGCSEILRRFLPSFFAHFNMNKAKLQRLVGKMGTPATRRLRRRSQPNMKELLSDINAWVAKAPVHELQKLPEKLESVQLYHPAEKLKRKIDKITAKKQSRCNEQM